MATSDLTPAFSMKCVSLTTTTRFACDNSQPATSPTGTTQQGRPRLVRMTTGRRIRRRTGGQRRGLSYANTSLAFNVSATPRGAASAAKMLRRFMVSPDCRFRPCVLAISLLTGICWKSGHAGEENRVSPVLTVHSVEPTRVAATESWLRFRPCRGFARRSSACADQRQRDGSICRRRTSPQSAHSQWLARTSCRACRFSRCHRPRYAP